MSRFKIIRGSWPTKADRFSVNRTIVEEVERRAKRFTSFDYGTPTINKPFSLFNDEVEIYSDEAKALEICNRYWSLNSHLAERVKRAANPNMPKRFPGGALGFALFNPNAPSIHPAEYTDIMAASDEYVRDIPPVSVTFESSNSGFAASVGARKFGYHFNAVAILGQPYDLAIEDSPTQVSIVDTVHSPGEIVSHPFLWNSSFSIDAIDSAIVVEVMNQSLTDIYSGMTFSDMMNDVRLVNRIIYKNWLAHEPEVNFVFQRWLLDRIKTLKATTGSRGFLNVAAPISTSLLESWILGGLAPKNRRAFPVVRKNVQARLFQEILSRGILADGDAVGDVAYLCVQKIAGRDFVPGFAAIIDTSEFSDQVQSVMDYLTYGQVSEELKDITSLMRRVEVANEFLAGNTQIALTMIMGGLRIWPEDPYLWRQRGIVHLATRNYGAAYRDLCWAGRMNTKLPDMDEIYQRIRPLVRSLDSAVL